MAGCLSEQNAGGSGSTDTATPTTTDGSTETPEPTTTPEDDRPLSVGDVVSLPGGKSVSVSRMGSSALVLTQGENGADVKGETGAYYVLVTFDGQNVDDYESLVTENATLVINDAEYRDPVFTYVSGSNVFTAAYRVPIDVTPYTGQVTLDVGDAPAIWEFDAGVIESITQAVSYSVSSVSVPDAVGAGSPFSLEVTVENGGDPMTFLAQVFGTKEAPIRVREDVPGSDSKTFEVAAKAPAADGDDEFDVTLDWGADSVTKTIAFE